MWKQFFYRRAGKSASVSGDWLQLARADHFTGEFLMSTGYLPGTHRPDCPAYTAAAAQNPPWTTAPAGFWD